MTGVASVTVVIPTYNRAQWLPETVSTVLNQSHRALEVLIVDDGSTDATREVCARFPPPVRYLWQANAGVSAARNLALREAKGDFIALLDSDDLWEPTKLEVQLALHQAFPEIGWSTADHLTIGLDGALVPGQQGFGRDFALFSDLGERPEEFFSRWFTRTEVEAGGRRQSVFYGDAYSPLFCGNFIAPSGVLLRREVVDHVGGFDEAWRLAEETEFFHRVAAVAPLGIVMTPLFRYRVGHQVRLVASENIVRLIENAILSGEQAARIRGPLSGATLEAYRTGKQRLLLNLAYTRLSMFDRAGARAGVMRAWREGARPSARSLGVLASSLVPEWTLRGLHRLKRAIRP